MLNCDATFFCHILKVLQHLCYMIIAIEQNADLWAKMHPQAIKYI